MSRVVVVAAVLIVLAGCAAPAPGDGAAASPSAPGSPSPLRLPAPVLQVVVVGDSITEADSPDFDDGDIGPGSWASTLDGDGVQVLGGWAHAGATTQDMVDGTARMDADVLVLMAGNNDLDVGIDVRATEQDLVRVADQVGVPRVVLSAVAPEDGLGDAVLALDDALQALAGRQGWAWVDPMTAVRARDGGWLPGASDDGVHPTAAAARLIGADLRTAVLA